MTGLRPEKNPLPIDVVSDVVCPWCFIGKRRLGKALAMRPQVQVVINWRPFQLDPTIPPDGVPRQTYLRNKFGSAERIAEIYQRLTEAGAAEGLAFAFDKITRSPNTLSAHRLVRWSHGLGRQDAIVEALFQAYFLQGRDIGSEAELIEIARECGIDVDLIRDLFETDADIEAVQEEIAVAGRLGITGVPFFIFGGSHAVSGAEAPETLARALDQALSHGKAAE